MTFDDVQQLGRYKPVIDDVAAIPITILSVTAAHVPLAAELNRKYRLLINDALICTIMQDNHLSNVASLDTDFDRVPGITRYSPI